MNNNLTERKQAEQKLQNEKQKFSIISENAPFGLVMVDKDGTFTHINPKFKKMFGYNLHDIPDGRTWFRKAYPDPDYRHEVISTWIDDSQKTKPGEQRPRVFTVTCKNGSRKIINLIAVNLKNGESIISFEDITERTRMEENLTKAYQTTRDIIDLSPFGIYVLGEEGTIEYINNAMLEISNDTLEQILGKNLFNLASYQELGITEHIRSGLKGKKFRLEAVRYTSYYGKKETIRNFIGIPLEQKGARKLLMIIEDITKQKKLEEEFQALSLKDELTGLYNRRGFFALGEQQLKIADRMKKDVLLIFTDLDRLKWINDNLGHEEGDRALVAASSMLKETFRESDIIARIGGDEFVVLAMEAIEDISQFITSRLQDNFDQYNTRTGFDYELSMSIGMVRYNHENPVSLDTLIALADKLMYEDKKRKNKSSIYGH